MNARVIRIPSVLVGPVAPLGARGVPSGIEKRASSGRVRLGREGLAGDAQGDRRHHGGPEKAVHHYDRGHYDSWREELGDRPALARDGAFGENLSTTGLDERGVAVGDVFRIGTAVVEVSQGRQPCWKLNLRFDVPDMARRVQDTGRTGWYYRVVEEGAIGPGDEMALLDRRSPEWTIDRLRRAFYVDTLDFDALASMADLPHLAESWRAHARRRLATRKVEDWTRRLRGEESAD